MTLAAASSNIRVALAFSEKSVRAWADAVEASGTAITGATWREAVQVASMAQFAPGRIHPRINHDAPTAPEG